MAARAGVPLPAATLNCERCFFLIALVQNDEGKLRAPKIAHALKSFCIDHGLGWAELDCQQSPAKCAMQNADESSGGLSAKSCKEHYTFPDQSLAVQLPSNTISLIDSEVKCA